MLSSGVSAALFVASTATFVIDETGLTRPPLLAWLPDWSWTAWWALGMTVLFVGFFEGSFRDARERHRRWTERLGEAQATIARLQAERDGPDTATLLRQNVSRAEAEARLELSQLIRRLHRIYVGRDQSPGAEEETRLGERAGLLKDQLAHHAEATTLWRDFFDAWSDLKAERARQAAMPVTEETITELFVSGDPKADAVTAAAEAYVDWLLMRPRSGD